jgi:hypothetical protein
MPVAIPCDAVEAIDLPEFLERYRDLAIDPSDQESLSSAAPLLKRLANNKVFLSEFILQEMRDNIVRQQGGNSYSSQVIVLAKMSDDAFLRANIWPSVDDEMYKKSGAEAFFYDVPHDHNFNFLTVGYWGSGYESDYYEYDYADISGYAGEPVQLRFVERRRLGEGEMLLYRASLDVHRQLPPSELSMTLNIMDTTPSVGRRNQYIFNDSGDAIRSVVSRKGSPALFNIAAALDPIGSRDLLLEIADRHESGFVRFHALRAAANAAADLDEAARIMARGTVSSQPGVASWSRSYLAKIEGHRPTSELVDV